jgi:hypothetical protein
MSSSLSELKAPRLASSSGGSASGLPYASWRPQMQTFLMRLSIEERDYTKEIPQWKELCAAVSADTAAALRRSRRSN